MLSEISTSTIAALGAYFKVQSFVFMPIFGINNGLVPVIASTMEPKTRREL